MEIGKKNVIEEERYRHMDIKTIDRQNDKDCEEKTEKNRTVGIKLTESKSGLSF